MSLDQLLRDAGQELDRMSDLHERSPSYTDSVDRGRHRLTAVTLAVVLVAAGVVGIVTVALRHDRATASSASGTSADRLLFPASKAAGLHILQALETPTTPDRWAGLAISPTGDAFGVSVLENFWGGLPSDQEQRSINGHTVAVQNLDGAHAYSISEACALISVTDQRAGIEAWDAASSALLASMTVDGGHVMLTLPGGWQSLGVGETNTLFGLSYKVTLNGKTHTVSLIQMLDAPVGTLLALVQSGAAVTSTDFHGAPAWLTVAPNPTFRSIVWKTGNGAALLNVDNASPEELKLAASMLEGQHGKDWANQLQHEPASGPATTAPHSETPLCARSLEIRP